MNQCADAQTWDRLQKISPHIFMIEWLAILDENNRSFEKLQRDLLSEEENSGQSNISFPPLLQLQEMDMRVLFQRLRTLCKMNTWHKERRFNHIFSHLSPLVALYYKRISEDYENSLSALRDMYQTFLPFESFILEKEYVEDGKFFHEVIDTWKRKYIDTENKDPLSPAEIALCLFRNDLFLVNKIQIEELTPRGQRFYYDVFFKSSPFYPWESILEPYKDLPASPDLSWRILSHEINREIFLDLDSLRKDPLLIVKEEDMLPGEDVSEIEREYASHIITNLVMGRGALDPLLTKNKDKRLLILQKPKSLDRLSPCEGHEDYLEKLDFQSTSEILLISMITNVAFDPAENFYLHKDDSSDQYNLIRFHHKGSLSFTFKGIYSFLFLLEHMNKKIHPGCLSKIIYKDPIHVKKTYKSLLEEWSFSRANKGWEALRIQSRSNIDSIWKTFEERTKFLTLSPMKDHLKDRLYRLHDFLWDYSFLNKDTLTLETTLTHADVFVFLKPDLGELYRNKLGQAYEKDSWQSFCPYNEGDILRRATDNTLGKTYEQDGEEFLMVMPEKRKLISGSLKEIKNEGDLESFLRDFRDIPEYERSRIIANSDFSKIGNEDRVSEFIKRLGTYKTRSLSLKNLNVLKSSHLKDLNFSYLSSLTLDSCPDVDDSFFKFLSDGRGENFVSISLINLPKFKHFTFYKTFYRLNLWPQEIQTECHFPNLRSLTLLQMPSLETVILDSPNLYQEYLTIDEKTLKNIKKNNFDKIKSVSKLKPFMRECKFSDFHSSSSTEAYLRNYEASISLEVSDDKKNMPLFTGLEPRKYYELQKKYYTERVNASLGSLFEVQDDSFLNETLLSSPIKSHFKNWSKRFSAVVYPDEILTFLDLYALGITYKRPENQNILCRLDLGRAIDVSNEENFSIFLSLLQSSLQELYLNDIVFTNKQWEALLPFLKKMTNLRRLSLSRSSVPQESIKKLTEIALGNLKELFFLGLSGNYLDEKTLSHFLPLLNHPSLETIDLTYNLFGEMGAQRFLKSTSLSKRCGPMPSFLFKGNEMSSTMQNEIDVFFVDELLKRVFDKKEKTCLFRFTQINVIKKLQDYIEAVYHDTSNARPPFLRQRMNPQSLLVLGEGLFQQALLKKKLILENYVFEKDDNKDDFSFLFDRYLSKIVGLKVLSLENNALKPHDAPSISSILKKNSLLEKVNLQKNFLDASGFQDILDGLKNLRNLKKIDFRATLNQKIEDNALFCQPILNILSSCAQLSTVLWDKDYFPTSLNQGIEKILQTRREIEIKKIRRELESKQLLVTPKKIVDLFQDMNMTQNKISAYFSVSQPNISGIKKKYPEVTGQKFILNLNEKTPQDFEKEFLEDYDFFIKRYGLSEKKYNLIKDEKGILLLLFSQPVKNPYCFMKEGFLRFKNDHLTECRGIIDIDSINDPKELIRTLTFQQNKNSTLMKALGFALFYFGTEGFSNKMETIDYFRRSLSSKEEGGNQDLLYFIGRTYLDLKKYQKHSSEKSFQHLLEASSGNAEACYFVAQLYKNGVGCKKDEDEYKNRLEKAARMGHIQANYESGLNLWLECRDHHCDPAYRKKRKSSFQHFNFAAQRGHIDAKVYVSLCQSKGFGVEKNQEKAFQGLLDIFNTFQQLSEILGGSADISDSNNSFALYHLGYFYEKGIGCQGNRKEAIKAYKEAKNLGSREAENQLKKLIGT